MSIIKKCNKNDINLMSEVKRFTKKIEKIHTPTNNIKKGAVKKLNIKTLEHDLQGVMPALNEINHTSKPIILIGDKGYHMTLQDRNELKLKHNATLIVPSKRNQKIQNTKLENKKLKGRYKVENMFGKIKAYNRIHVRRDKLIVNYMGFVHLACMLVA